MPTATNSSRACSSAVGELGREVQPLAVAGHALGQPGLVDRDLAALEPRDLVGVDVDAPHLVAELGEARRRDQPDVAGADDRDRFARVVMRRGRLLAQGGGTPRTRGVRLTAPFSVRRAA